MRYIAFFAFILLSLGSYAQPGRFHRWWNIKHNWDRVTPWQQYLIVSPGFFGPNALPVPEIRTGKLLPNTTAEVSFDHHFGAGDPTENIFSRLDVPLFSDRVSLTMSVVALEYYYNMDTLVRDARRSRDYDGEGINGGDFYFGTLIQLIKDHRVLPDVLISINIRTASGTGLEAARFTDTPGYFMDISFGKDIPIRGGPIQAIRPFGSTGLYVWQTFESINPQNDAILFGAGLNVQMKQWEFTTALGGYAGYKGEGDKPVVFRTDVKTTRKTLLNYTARFQQGLHDFEYSTVRVGVELNVDQTITKLVKRESQ